MSKKPYLNTIISPSLIDLYDIKDSLFVVIDVFRATSTFAVALYNGAKSIIPTDSVEDCIRIGQLTDGITAGERDGVIIEGLNHGNSPSEYPRDFIENKTLVITTTNGTKLLHQSLEKGVHQIITGSFPNLNSVVRYIIQQNRNVYLACAGWKNRFNIEDTLFAGAVIEQVRDHFTIQCDSSLMAENLYLRHKNNLANFIQKTTHWHRLSRYGLENDMLTCISLNIADCLPFFQNDKLIKQNF